MTKQERLASVVSNLAAPPVLAMLGAVLVAMRSAEQGAWLWVLLFGAAAIVVPSAYVVIEVLRGRISDIHIPLREQRTRPYLVALACAALVLGLAMWWPAPVDFRMLALAYGLQAILFFLITLRWKISLHSAAAGGLTVLGITILSATGGLLLGLTIPAVAWSRVRLHRHTLAQTVGGAMLGALVVAVSWWVVA